VTFLEALRAKKGDLFKASVAYCKARGWTREQWYEAWQTTSLPDEVEQAVRASREA
jgi:hypothetical protein